MSLVLRQSTAVDVLIGPFVDKTDGATAEEAESPSVLLSKNGQTLGAKNDTTTPTHDDAGYYNCELDATDTNTVGTLVLAVEASGNALPVRHEFQVIEEAVYDAFFAGSADLHTASISDIESSLVIVKSDLVVLDDAVSDVESSLVIVKSDLLQVYSDTTKVESDVAEVDTSDIHSLLTLVRSDTAHIESDAAHIESDAAHIESDTTHIESDAAAIEVGVSDTESALVVIKSDLAQVYSDTTIIASDAVQIYSDTTIIASDTTRIEAALIAATGALEGTPSSTVLQTDLAETTNDHYNNMVFVMTSGDEAGEARRILDYTGASGTITLETALSGSPSAAETFVILNIPVLGEPTEWDKLTSDAAAIEVGVSDTESALVKVYSDTTIIVSDTTAIETGVSDAESALVKVYSDTTKIESDAAAIEVGVSDTESSLVIVKSDLLQVYSDTTIIASDVVQVYSDTTALTSQVLIVKSDTSDIRSALVKVYSDTTKIESDTTAIEAAGGGLTTAQASWLSQVHSDVIHIGSDLAEVDTSDIHSLLTLVRSDTAHIESDAAAVEVGVSDTESALVVIKSDLAQVYSDTTHIDSDVVVVGSQVLIVKSDTSDIRSALTKVYSDTTQVASDTAIIEAAPTTQITESYAANGTAPTRDQALMAIHQMLMQFAISGTSITVKKLDNSTTAFTVTLDDDTNPTSAART